jgi:hypothetical protein
VLDTELGGEVEAIEASFILSGVVGHQKMNLEHVLELVFRWHNKQHTCPSALDVQSTVKGHILVYRVVFWVRLLNLDPFGDEIS